MANKSIQFKNPSMRLSVAGMGKVTNDNITPEKYERLLKLNPSHADFFIIKEEKENESKPKTKTKENE